MKAEGYALIYDQVDKEGLIYDKGCLEGADFSEVKMTDYKNRPFSSTTPKTLELTIDEKGLKFITDLPMGLTYGKDMIENIRNGNVVGVDLFADTEEVLRGGRTHVTKIKKLRGIIISTAADGRASSIKLVSGPPGLHEMSDKEYSLEKEKLKLQLELM